MKYLVVLLGFVGLTTCLEWNPLQVQDTPEVAAAKAAHLAALAKAKEKARERAKYAPDGSWIGDKNSVKDDESNGDWDHSMDSDLNGDDGTWKEDESWKNYDDGSWVDDMETTEKPKPVEQRWDGQNQKWTGPVALPPGYDETGAPLPVEDTPEVAAAKAKHLLLYAKAVSRSRESAVVPVIAEPKKNNKALFTTPGKTKVRLAAARSAPPPERPAPVWETFDFGEVQDTPEVAAAKAAHYAAHAKRRS